MEMTEIMTMISNVGFPIACVIGMAYFIKGEMAKTREVLEKNIEVLASNTEVMKSVLDKIEGSK